MKHQIKLAVSDIDGTLVNKDKRVTPLTREAIKAFQERGGSFTLATGRIEKSAIPFCRELNIGVPVILYNGARIVDPLTEEVLWEKSLHKEDLNRALELRSKYPFDYLIYLEGEAFVFERSDAVKLFEKGDGYKCTLITDPRMFSEREVTKILMIGDNQHFSGFREDFCGKRKNPAALVQSESNFLEILPAGVNKGTALDKLQEILGLNRENIVCFGDNMNDIEMLRNAGTGIAMGNARSEVKEAADQVTSDHNNDGVGCALNELLS
jgi:Cof subfamily protein (haloacid dehalogenase superfamily)